MPTHKDTCQGINKDSSQVTHNDISRPAPRVLASRPHDQNGHWCEQLQKQGFTPVDIPMLAINPVSDATQNRTLQTCMLNIDAYSTLIFVSQNAVKYFFERFDYYWPQLLEDWCLIGVGKATQEAIQTACDRFGGAKNLCILGGENAMNSEALLTLPELQNVSEQKILLCRGVGGRARIGDTLSERGAQITYCELYQRDIPSHAVNALKKQTFDAQHDSLVFFSGETLHNFSATLQQTTTTLLADHTYATIRVIVPSPRVHNMAQTLGFKNIHTAHNATADAMLAALKQSYSM